MRKNRALIIEKMKMRCIFILFFFLLSNWTILAQFNGSNGDGFALEKSIKNVLTGEVITFMFMGGNGDGFDVEKSIKNVLTGEMLTFMYAGGNGDGFDVEKSIKNVLTGEMLTFMYAGGNGDGFDVEKSIKNVLTGEMLTFMYAGGNGDGFDVEKSIKNVLTGEVITFMYAGGNGDGFDVEKSVKNVLTGEVLTFMYAGGNGDGFSSMQELVYLDPNQIVDLKVNIKVFLQGPLLNPVNAGLMNDILRSDGKLPTLSPYSDLASINASVLNDGGTTGTGLTSDDIVDWIWVEIRDSSDNGNVINSKSALVQRDGDVVALDGTSELIIPAMTNSYYIVVKHRNHLGVMSSAPIALSVVPVNINFTSNITPTFGSNAQVQLTSGSMALWAGDSNGMGEVRYSGSNNDSNLIKDHVLADPANGFNSVTFPSSGYLLEDTDLNGFAKFSGSGNDSNYIKDNVLNHPLNGFNSLTFTIFTTVPPEN